MTLLRQTSLEVKRPAMEAVLRAFPDADHLGAACTVVEWWGAGNTHASSAAPILRAALSCQAAALEREAAVAPKLAGPEFQRFVDALPDMSPVQVVAAVQMLRQAQRIHKSFGGKDEQGRSVPQPAITAETVRAKVHRLYKLSGVNDAGESAGREE